MLSLEELIEKIKADKAPINIAMLRDALSDHGFQEEAHGRTLNHAFRHETQQFAGEGIPLTPIFKHKKHITNGRGGFVLTPEGKKLLISALEAALALEVKINPTDDTESKGHLDGGLTRGPIKDLLDGTPPPTVNGTGKLGK